MVITLATRMCVRLSNIVLGLDAAESESLKSSYAYHKTVTRVSCLVNCFVLLPKLTNISVVAVAPQYSNMPNKRTTILRRSTFSASNSRQFLACGLCW